MIVNLPMNFQLKRYMLPFLQAPQRFKIAVIHRRGRKTRMALNEQIRKTQQKVGVYYFVLPTYKQAKQVIWDELIKDHLPMEIVDKKNDSELAIYYKNGSIQRFVGSEDPDKHRGVNAIDWVFDEFSEHKDARMWLEIAQPVLRENKGTATFIFTPKGRNHSWKLLQFAKDHEDQWFTTVINAAETNVFTPEELQSARQSMPESLFGQELMCEFLDSATGFFRRIDQNVYQEFEVPRTTYTYQLGIDLAKYQDFTVITPFNHSTFKVLPQERFNQVDWNLQKARIDAAQLRFNHAKCMIDGTGLGDPIVEDLQVKGMDVESFKFTEQSRRDLLNNLAVMLEQDKIKIPNDEGLIEELKGFQYSLGENGKIKVQSVEQHDDRVMSLALAVWKAPQEPLGARMFGSGYTHRSNSEEFDPYSSV